MLEIRRWREESVTGRGEALLGEVGPRVHVGPHQGSSGQGARAPTSGPCGKRPPAGGRHWCRSRRPSRTPAPRGRHSLGCSRSARWSPPPSGQPRGPAHQETSLGNRQSRQTPGHPNSPPACVSNVPG